MNERIKELAGTARIKPIAGSWYYRTYDEFEQEFARLIIEECCSILDQQEPHNSWTKRNSTIVKEHFGV